MTDPQEPGEIGDTDSLDYPTDIPEGSPDEAGDDYLDDEEG